MPSRKTLAIRHRKGLRQLRRWSFRPEDITPQTIGIAGTTPVPCSCLMCGNYRRTQKGRKRLTVQERRVLLPDE